MDEMTLLREMRGNTADPLPETLARHRRAVMVGIGALPAQSAARNLGSNPGRRKVRSRVTLMAAAAAFLVGIMVTADVVLPEGGGRASAEAAQALNAAAEAAIRTSDPVVLPGQYLKIETREQFTNTFVNNGEPLSWDVVTGGQVYIPSDIEGEWVWNRDDRVPVDSAPEVVKEAHRLRPSHADLVGIIRAPGGNFYDSGYTVLGAPLADMSSLPRDPKKLLERVYEHTEGQGKTPDLRAFEAIVEALRTGSVPADLRAAFYEAAARIPGVELSDRQATVDGRTGMAIGVLAPGGGGRHDMIIDPATGLMIGEQYVTVGDPSGNPADTVESWTSVRTTVVDSAP